MTVSTRESLARVVIRMTERITIRTRGSARRPVRFLIVANSTRCNLTPCIRFARRCVARVATIMRGEIRRYRQTHAAIDRRVVTTSTTTLRSRRAGHMLCVIELHVERFIEARRKILQRRIVAADVSVADHAHRHLRRGELAAMAICARLVTGETRCCRVVAALVTGVAGERTVTLTVVKKLRIVELRALRQGRAEEQ